MKITKAQIQQIIREEINEMINKDQKVWVGQTYQRDEESADHREDHNIDDLWAMVRDLRRELDDMRDKK
jgi:hypothetical protein